MSASERPNSDFDQFRNYDRPAATEKALRDLLPAAEAIGDPSYHAQLLTQIARAQGLQRRFSEAHATLDAAQALLTPDLAQARVRYLLERGRVFNSSGNVPEARPLFLDAWQAALAAGEDYYAVDAAHMMGIVEPPDRQLEWNLKALELAERSAEPRARRWLGLLYNNIGWSYHDLGQYEQALELFQRALAWREEVGEDRPIQIARWAVGRALRSLDRILEALASQRALLVELERAGEPVGYACEEIGECLRALDQPDEARPYFARAYEALSRDPWLAEREPERIARLGELGGQRDPAISADEVGHTTHHNRPLARP